MVYRINLHTRDGKVSVMQDMTFDDFLLFNKVAVDLYENGGRDLQIAMTLEPVSDVLEGTG